MNLLSILRRKLGGGAQLRSTADQPLEKPGPLDRDLSNHYQDNEVDSRVKLADPVWLADIDMDDLLVFVHVPKAAGTSLNAILWQVYGRGYVNYHRKLSSSADVQRIIDHPESVLAIGGHMPHGFHRSFKRFFKDRWPTTVFAERHCRYITVLRDPVERMKSYYRFVTTFPAHHLYAETQGMTPTAFFRYMERTKNPECFNLQCRLVGRSRRFEEARDYLTENYHVVGIVDRIDDFIRELQRTLNWPNIFEMKRRNRSPAIVDDDDFGQDVIDWIIENNEADARLYEFTKRELAPGR